MTHFPNRLRSVCMVRGCFFRLRVQSVLDYFAIIDLIKCWRGVRMALDAFGKGFGPTLGMCLLGLVSVSELDDICLR